MNSSMNNIISINQSSWSFIRHIVMCNLRSHFVASLMFWMKSVQFAFRFVCKFVYFATQMKKRIQYILRINCKLVTCLRFFSNNLLFTALFQHISPTFRRHKHEKRNSTHLYMLRTPSFELIWILNSWLYLTCCDTGLHYVRWYWKDFRFKLDKT